MIKLLKYELIRKKKIYVITLCIFAVLTLLVAFGIPRLDNNYWIFVVSASTLVVIVGGILLPLIINTAKYYGDYKNRNGFMMFLTPNSGAKIFGSKLLAAIIDTLAIFIMIGLFGLISYSVANANYAIQPHIDLFWSQLLMQFPGINAGALITLSVAVGIVQSISTIILALFSITVSKTLLSHRSINWFIPLVIFLVLMWIEQLVTTLIIAAQNFNSFVEMISSNNMTLDISLVLLMAMVLSIAFAAAYTIIGSRLITKKLDL